MSRIGGILLVGIPAAVVLAAGTLIGPVQGAGIAGAFAGFWLVLYFAGRLIIIPAALGALLLALPRKTPAAALQRPDPFGAKAPPEDDSGARMG